MTVRPTSSRPTTLSMDGDIATLAREGVAVAVFSLDGRTLVWATPACFMLFGFDPWKGCPQPVQAGYLQTKLESISHGEAPTEGFLTERVRLPGQRFGTITLAFREIALTNGQSALLVLAEHLNGPATDLSTLVFTNKPAIVDHSAMMAVEDAPQTYVSVSETTIITVEVIAEQPEPVPAFVEDAPEAASARQDSASDQDTEANAAEGVDVSAIPPPLPTPLKPSDETSRAPVARTPTRFNWQADPTGRFGRLAEPARTLLAPAAQHLEGKTLIEVGDETVLEPTGEILAAFGWRNTFTGILTLWRQPDDSWIEVKLSGTPYYFPDGAYGGFRGFGIIGERIPTSTPVKTPAQPEQTSASEVAEPTSVDPEPAVEADITPAFEGARNDAPPKDDLIEPEPTAPELSKPELVKPHSPTPAPHKPHTETPAEPTSKLSANERQAFREIARALGAHIDEPPEPTPPPEAPQNQFPPEETSSADVADADLGDETAASPTQPIALQQSATSSALVSDVLDLPEPHSEPEPPPSRAQADSDDLPAPPPEDIPDSARLQDLLDRLPIGILLSRGSVPIFMNRPLLDQLDYADADQFHDEGAIETLFAGHPAARQDQETMALTTRNGDIVPMQVRLQTVDWGGLPASLMTFSPAPDTETLTQSLQRISALEAELVSQEAQIAELGTILDTATDGVLVLDRTGRILAGNLTAEALFGYEASEMVGESVLTLLAPESHALARDYLDALNSNGVASVLNDGREVLGRVRQGGNMPLFMTMGRISDGVDPKFCAVLRDITAWKQAETELLASKQEAEKASAQKSDVLTKISHELRTPLSAIMGFAEVMMEERLGPVANDRYKEYLRDIHNSGQHVLSLVNDLLDLAKIEAGKFDLDFEAIDLNEIVSGGVSLIQPQAGRSKVVIRVGLMPKLPQIVADARSLRQIMLNLLSNAVKFTDAGGQVIVATTLTEAGEVVLRVRDTGIGMDETDIEAALEPFRQTRAGRKAGGTGLGLPLTKALTEANRARFAIRSARDAGTLIEITFPTTRVLAS